MISLEIERMALKRETDKNSKERLEAVVKELASLKEPAPGFRAGWKTERDEITRWTDVKKKIEALRFEMEEQTRRGNLERSAAIQYGELPQLEAGLKKLEALQDGAAESHRLLKEEVDEEDIAKIVSKWTGIPVDKMLEGEVEKLIHMETRLRQRVVGQEQALET